MNEYTYIDLYVGASGGFSVTITENMVQGFRDITGDNNPLHCDQNYACGIGEGMFSDKVVYGMLTSSFYSTLVGLYIPGKYSLIHSVDIKMSAPVYVGDVLKVEGSVIEKNDIFHFIVLKVSIKNQSNIKVSKGKIQVGLLE